MKFIFSYLLILGVIFSFVIPPFQKPDETVHFQKTLIISQGVFNCPKNNQILINQQYIDLIQKKSLQTMIAKKNIRINPTEWFIDVFKSPTTRPVGKPVTINQGVCQLPTIPYLPQASGLVISQFLNLNQYLSFFLGRFFGFLIFFTWFYFLYRITQKSIQSIILLVFALPMTIHQLTSYSYDGMQIMLAITGFVAGTKLMENKFKKINWWLILGLSIFSFFVSRTIVEIIYPSTINPAGQIILLKNNPLSILEIIIKTTYFQFPFYLQGLVGIFGWLEYGLDYLTYFFYLLLVVFIIFQTKLEKKLLLLKWQNIVLGFIIFSYYLVLLFINYLFWTPYKSKIVDGIQGRYFIIIFPFLIYFLINIRQQHFPKLKIKNINIPNWIIIILGTTICALILRSIILRFYF